jgi:long-subunit fatty acid transport protein
LSKLIFCFLSLILFSRQLFSQYTFDYEDHRINPFWNFYSENNLSASANGRGITGTASDNDISGINLNPASWNMESKFQLHAEVVYKSNVTWLPELELSDLYLKQVHPTVLAGAGYKPFQNFQAGFIYHNDNSFALNIGEIIATNEFGEELYRYEAVMKVNRHSFTVPLAYRTKMLSVGAAFTYSLFTGYEGPAGSPGNGVDIDSLPKGTSSFGKFIPAFGIIFTPAEIFSVGLSFTPQFEEAVEWKWQFGGMEQTETFKETVFPLRLAAGSELRTRHFNVLLDYRFDQTSTSENLKDRHSVHFGMEYPVNDTWLLRGGFFAERDYRREDVQWLDAPGSYDRISLTLGSRLKLKDYTINLSVMDSHISSGIIQMTQVNASINYEFNKIRF